MHRTQFLGESRQFFDRHLPSPWYPEPMSAWRRAVRAVVDAFWSVVDRVAP